MPSTRTSCVCPPETSNATKGKAGRLAFQHRCQQVSLHVVDAQGRNPPAQRQGPGQGGTHHQGTDEPRARRVGHPVDLALASRPASARTAVISGSALRMWSREASSGTTPPYSRCTATWLKSACARRPRSVSKSAMPVSSQEVSMPSTRTDAVEPMAAAWVRGNSAQSNDLPVSTDSAPEPPACGAPAAPGDGWRRLRTGRIRRTSGRTVCFAKARPGCIEFAPSQAWWARLSLLFRVQRIVVPEP
jgi:hypothetical protein